MTDTDTLRPFSTSSIISPHAALEALVADSDTTLDLPPSASTSSSSSSRLQPADMDITEKQAGSGPFPSNLNTEQGSNGHSASSDTGTGSRTGHPHPTPQGAPGTSGTASTNGSSTPSSLGQSAPPSPKYMVRAQFDFDASDPSALSFKAGDIIEVYTMLESGWWDGMLDGRRGWFPSNFVEEIDDEGDEEGSSSSQNEYSHGLGLVGDQMDRERDMQMLEREDFGVPLHHPSNRTRGRSGSGLGGADGFGGNLDELMRGGAGWGSGPGLDDLAREMMESNLQDEEEEEDEGAAFEAEAARRREARRSDDTDTGEFGNLRTPHHPRRREHTDNTIRQRPSVASGGAGASDASQGITPVKQVEETQDAWIPSLTPDGQVYYLNTQTGESSWEIPVTTPSADEEDFYYSNRQSGEYFNTYSSAPSSSAHLDRDRDASNTEESFRMPLYSNGEIPYPWVARMTDDGRSFVYHNRVTGQTTSQLPTNGGHDDFGGLARHRQSPAGSLPIRASVELQRKQVQDWERRTRLALEDLLKQSNKPTLAFLIDNVTDALREVFEATVAGSAADEEMSRAHDMGSESGMATAALREEAAREMLAEAHTATLAVLRELLASFGYVGPLDKMEELPRPAWATDVTLIGSIGLLSSNVHAAVTSRVGPESGLTVWSEVMRTATRLRDVVVDLPHRMGIHDTVEGKRLGAWLGIDTFDILGGRWGFGTTKPGTIHEDLQPLDQNLVVELQRIKSECEAVARAGEILDLMRVGSKFEKLLSTAEIASIIDIDGEVGDDQVSRARLEDLELYMDLVGRARKSLLELDTAYTSFTPNCVKLLTNPNPTPFLVTLDRCFTAISTLLVVTREQNALLSQSQIRGSVGFRSSLYRLHRQKPRPQSMVSQVSGTSKTSRASRLSDMDEMRRKAKSMEQEYADEEQNQERLRERERQKDIERERERVAAAASASASQTSLSLRKSISGRAGRTHRTTSAASSSTSLAFKDTESESGSTKGTNRSSFMRFMKGRSSEDDGNRRTKPNKKLAKLLGEDSFAGMPINHLPPQAQTVPAPLPLVATPIPERPWYLGEDYDPSEIVFDDRGVVKAGTLKALVARLTPHGSTDTAFFQAFLLTFRSFTSGDDLMTLLLQRYHIQPPAQLATPELVEWKKQKQTPIRLRVVNTIRSWIDVHYLEEQDASILDRVEQFAESLSAEGSLTMGKQLSNLVARRVCLSDLSSFWVHDGPPADSQRSSGAEGPRRTASGGLLSPPAPLVPRVPSGRSIRLLDISPVELARQLTIIESLHFQRIRAIECLNKAWAKEEGPKSAPNVRWVILTANRMAGWVALQILNSKDVKIRAATMKYFVQTAIELRNLNNFSSMAGVVAGLNSAPITRLKRTKELLSAKTSSLKANLDATLDSSKNFANYKDMLKTINPPCVPFFGFYLSALTFIEDGNKDMVQPEGHTVPLINFFKRSLSADILRDIQQYQSQPYNLARCKPVYDYITDGLEVVEGSGDLYEMSLVLEPREREEERVARMLHDSGFL